MKILTLLFVGIFPVVNSLFGQSDEAALKKLIYAKDSLFWKAYNTCNVAGMQSFIAADVEFYHDRGGMTLGIDKMMETTRKNLCGDNPTRLRREALDGSVEIFSLTSDGVIYGAIISGEHIFYVLEPGKPERADGLAKFTHVWRLIDKEWKMYRILSYDHGPAPYISQRKAITLSDKQLNMFAGSYHGPNAGNMIVQTSTGTLRLTVGNETYTLFPLSDTSFFVKERDLVFEFGVEKGVVTGLTVKEKGNAVEIAVRQKQ
jgi:hypothetical protein